MEHLGKQDYSGKYPVSVPMEGVVHRDDLTGEGLSGFTRAVGNYCPPNSFNRLPVRFAIDLRNKASQSGGVRNNAPS